MATIVRGRVRFSVITPECIRIEEQEQGQFIDAPSWFAVNRQAGYDGAKVSESGNRLEIDTGRVKLTCRDDGRPLGAANLTAEIRDGDRVLGWYYGQCNQANLGGTLQTLDGLKGAVPLPEGLLSRDGWFWLDDSSTHLFVDDWIAPRPAIHGTDGYLFAYGRDFKAALRSLTAIGGAVPLPRKVVLGSWYSRWYPYTDDHYRQIVQEYEEHDTPLDIMVMDMDWHERRHATTGHGWAKMLGWSGWTWDRQLIKDPESLLRWYHDRQLSVTLNVHPHDGIRSHEECYPAFMKALGEDPATGGNLPFRAGDRKYMAAYFDCAHTPLERQGVDFWWVDWQQDSIMPEADGIVGMKHLPLLNHLYYRHSASGGRRGISFSRWAGWGDHRYPINFSGDANCTWVMLAFEIFFTATAGNVGCFFWSHDIGGFCGKRDPEQYARWVQFGITTAAVRIHSTGDELDRRPWKWGAQVEESIRRSFRLRAELIPYLYSQVRLCHTQSLPLIRPMYLQHPEEDNAYLRPHQYYCGEALLAAPIMTPGDGSDLTAGRDVWLPDGVWYNWFTGARHPGGTMIRCEAGLNEFPLFVRGGYPVCLQPYTRRMTSAPLEVLRIRLAWAGTGFTAELYEDDGLSDGYLRGDYALTSIGFVSADSGRGTITIEPIKDGWKGRVRQRRYVLELLGFDQAGTVRCQGKICPLKHHEGGLIAMADLSEVSVTESVICEIA